MIEPFDTIFAVFGNVLSDFREWALEHSLCAGLLLIFLAWLLRDVFGALAQRIIDTSSYLVAGAGEWCHKRCQRWSDSADRDEEQLRKDNKKTVVAAIVSSLLVVAAVAVLCIFNYSLLIIPLNDIVGEEFGYIGAVGIIILEFIAGSAVLVFLGRSNLLTLRRADEEKNHAYAIVAFVFFILFCIFEVMAAIWRDFLIQQELATRTPEGDQGIDGADPLGWMPTTMQAVLGFAVPWGLMLASLSVEEVLRVVSLLLRRLGAVVAKVLAIIFDWVHRAIVITIFICVLIYAIIIILPEVVIHLFWFIVEKFRPGFLPAREDLWQWVRGFQTATKDTMISDSRSEEVALAT